MPDLDNPYREPPGQSSVREAVDAPTPDRPKQVTLAIFSVVMFAVAIIRFNNVALVSTVSCCLVGVVALFGIPFCKRRPCK